MHVAIPLEVEVMVSLTDAVGVLLHIHRIASAKVKPKGKYTEKMRLADIDVLAREVLDRVVATTKKMEE